MNFNITRRQFLQYCTASAAALGLSQMDLLKLEKALATPQPATSQPSPSVIWLTAQACSGCPVALLNRVNKYAGNPYYDADMLNALYPTAPGGLALPGALGNDSAGLPLQVVNDAADLLVGDAVRALTGIARSNLWADDMSGVLPGTLLDAYMSNPVINGFPQGYVTLEWNSTVMAAAGDIPAGHLRAIRDGGGLLGKYVVVVDGAIPPDNIGGNKANYCFVFDNIADDGFKVMDPTKPGSWTDTALGGPVTAANALRWLTTSLDAPGGNPRCLAVISVGTCASFGGIPAAAGNRTGAMSVASFLASHGISTPVINVPGCPPHPDWIVYPVAHVLATTPGDLSSLGVPALDQWGRPKAVYQGSGNHGAPHLDPFCLDCPNKDTQGTPQAAQNLGDAGCLGSKGCKGQYTIGDCPIRGKNTTDDGLSMNWCVGASGQNSNPNAPSVSHLGEARHPCQGCIMQDFPDWRGLTALGTCTSRRIKGFYNA